MLKASMLSPILIEKYVRMALEEDLGHGFDITSNLVVPADQNATAVMRARKPGILAGIIVALSAFGIYDPDFEIEVDLNDGAKMEAGTVIASVHGPARSLLTAERSALNFITHLSGIATLTRAYVDAVEGTGAQITDTRKTLPGLRMLQKYAVAVGGGSNHRHGLDDAILIKDNHIQAANSINVSLDRARSYASHTSKIEIEVDTLIQLEKVLAHGGADIVMLDNMDVKTLRQAVDLAKGKVILEASGGVTIETVRAIAETGVDYISVGALTHSAPALDIGLDFELA